MNMSIEMISDADLPDFRRILEQQQATLSERVRTANQAGLDRGEDLGREVSDRKDEAADELRSLMDSAGAERDAAALRQVDAALQRLSRGTYGMCLDCGEAIPQARLRAQPATERCTPCQADRERRHDAGGEERH
jgi:RNA polymerase-binding protein DksA